ncbi:TonB-dependent receptor [Rhizorhabdus wittichii]|uniref:TonB-dependent receptor n=1 Tax=Rhizorhabdus wittichii TaxID=160791 RepID=A0A975D2G0_9SPHN|nr:TonB-dependent receptor [Rhizorhabdus wittichii]
MRTSVLFCTVSLVTLSFSAAALAQAEPRAEAVQPTSDDAHADRPELGDIVVTAQKREQSLANVGMTIQAASAATLSDRGVQGPADLVKIVPGFTYTEGIYATPVYTLRGIGLFESAFGGAPAVAIYTDEVPRNVPIMSGALDLDLERVEVLKGPQGTLFGQSATGGAINYIVAKPTDHFEAGGDLGYERFGKMSASGFVSGPLTDSFKARLAVGAVQGGAWQRSISRPDDENGATRRLQGRFSIDWKPVDRLRVQASLTGVRDRSDPIASQYAGTNFNIYSASALAAANADPATANPYGYVDEARYAGITTPGSPNYDASFLGRQALIVARMNGVAPIPSIPDLAEGSRELLGTPLATNARQAEWTPGFLRRNHNDYYQGIVRADYDLTDDIALTSLSALAKQKMNYVADLDATAARGIDSILTGNVRSFNQELRLAGKTDALHWIAGATYDNIRASQGFLYDFAHGTLNAPVGLPIEYTQGDIRTSQKTYAAFGNVEYEVAGNLTVQAGLRYTKNKLTGSYCYFEPSFVTTPNFTTTFGLLSDVLRGLPPFTTQVRQGDCLPLGDGQNGTTLNAPQISRLNLKLNQDNWSFHLGANYKFDQGTLIYATIKQGYKAGLFSAIGATVTDEYDPAVQEKVIAYEAGFKAPLLNGRLRVNGAAFYYDYTNKQVRARLLVPIFGLLEKLVNVPKSYVWGLEGELFAEPVDGLTLNGSATYLKSRVSGTFRTTADGLPVYNNQGYTGDFKGSALPFTPKFSANADVQYEWTAGGLKPFVGAGIRYQGGSNATFENRILLAGDFRIPGYETVDVRLGLGAEDGSWKLTAFGRNVFNKYYVVARNIGLDTNFQTAGAPATYGVMLRVRIR